jgi:hypothetical protein
MRILLDHNTPAPLRYALIGHQVETAYERGWAELTNGELLRNAEQAGFEAMITTDKGIRYQQNLAGRTLVLVVLSTNDWTRIRKSTSIVVDAISGIAPGSFIEIEIPSR